MPARWPAWLTPARWRPYLKLIAAIASVLLAIGLLTLFLASQRQQPPASTAVPATVAATPIATATLAASPAAVAWPHGSLPALLSMAPDWLDAGGGLPVQARYAGIAPWLAAQGVDPNTLTDDELRAAIAPLALPEPVRAAGATQAWRDAYGFDLRQVDAVLAVGQAPNLVLIMPGRYDPATLYATWVASGYQAVEVEEVTVWSLVPGDRIDLSAPASRPALGMLNTMILLDDGTLIASTRQSLMAETLRVVQGRQRSLAAHKGLAAALPGTAGAVSAVLATGDLLLAPGGETGTTPVPDADIALPDVDLVLVALPPDGTPVTMSLVLDEPADAEQAVLRAIRERLARDAAWSARWRVDDIRLDGDGRLVAIDIAATSGDMTGLEIADPGELEPFRWTPSR